MGLSNATSVLKKMSGSLYLGVFKGGNRKCMLFTSLVYAFFSDLEDPLATNLPEIILISPMGALLPPHLWLPFLLIPLLSSIRLYSSYKLQQFFLTD